MALAFFINIFKQIEISLKGVSGKSDQFFIVLPIGVGYWPLLFLCGRTAALIPLWQRPSFHQMPNGGRSNHPQVPLGRGSIIQSSCHIICTCMSTCAVGHHFLMCSTFPAICKPVCNASGRPRERPATLTQFSYNLSHE